MFSISEITEVAVGHVHHEDGDEGEQDDEGEAAEVHRMAGVSRREATAPKIPGIRLQPRRKAGVKIQLTQ